MNSKVSKSEKTKLKFAQSNINHVYRGNAAETQHKPAVRQYGMQVVGKLQGTRRLPPPAWVPSLKAESGGVDSRVTLVPPGGGGWGASTNESVPSCCSASTSTEVVGLSITSTVSTVNGCLSRDAIETIFEPAYTRSKFESSTADIEVTRPSVMKSRDASDLSPNGTAQIDRLSGHVASMLSLGPDSGNEISTKISTGPSKASVSVASGGLAANKPFFQRPTTLAVSASVSTTQSDAQRPSTLKKVGACEVVGEPTGWAVLSNQEINFDERILFSDDEDDPENVPEVGGAVSNAKPTTQTDSSISVSAPTPLDVVAVSITQSMAVTLPKTDCIVPLGTSPTTHGTGDIWSTPGGSIEFGLPGGQSSQQLMAQMSEASLLPVCSTERILLDNQYLPHSTPHTFNTTFNEHYFMNNVSQESVTPSASAGFADSTLPSIDVDAELQHAQRQARTQEFRSAVERAQQARMAHQKMSSRNTSDPSQRSMANLICEASSNPNSLHPQLAPPKFSDNAPFPINQSSAHQMVGNTMQSQLFCPRIQATNQHRPDLAAAVAAATAVAVACSGNSASPHMRSTGALLPPTFITTTQPYQQLPPDLQSVTTGICDDWTSPFPSIPASSVDLRGTHSSTVPQVLQNTLNAVCPRGVSPRTNTVFLNPDYLVEKFLEILNRQQGLQPSSDTLINPVVTDAPSNVLFSSTIRERVPIPQPTDRCINHMDPCFSCTPCSSDELNTSDLNDLVSKTESLPTSTFLPTAEPDMQYPPSIAPSLSEHTETKPEGKRVPGLMEVKVSTTSLDFAHLWEQNDAASSAFIRGSRGSSKTFSDRTKPHNRGRRSVVFSSGTAFSANIDARSAHPQRTSASPSTHTRHGTNFRDAEHHEELSTPNQRRIASGREDRRYSSTQKFHHAAASGPHRQRDYFQVNRFSDGEQAASTTDGLHTRRQQSNFHSNRADASPQRVSKVHSHESNADSTEQKSGSRSLDDKEESAESTVIRGRGGPKFHSHFYSRGSRLATSRGGSSWRASAKSLTIQQENSRRSSGSHGQISHRNRGQRDYHGDGRDGEGGAAAGGAGRSNTGAEGSSSTGSNGTCGVDGYSNVSGNQKSGGNRESGPTDNPQDRLAGSEATISFAENAVSSSIAVTAITSRNNRQFLDKNRAYFHPFGQDRKQREYNASASGSRLDRDQFFRLSSSRGNKSAQDRHRSNLSHIPPLMSIKPRGFFTYHERGSESATGDAAESPANDPLVTEPAERPVSSDTFASDVDSLHSDGFTKVVPKASRKLARKRLQHDPPFNRPSRSQPFLVPDASCSRTFHFTTGCKSSEFSTSKTSHRYKTSPFKPTFMGPPLSTVSGMSTASLGATWATSNSCDSAESAENWDSRTRVRLSVDPPVGMQTSGSRTWSKVVGSRFSAVDSDGHPHALLDHPPDSKWSKPTINSTTDVVAATLQGAPVSSCSQLVSSAASVPQTDTSNPGAVEYNPVQRLWSSNCLGQNEFPTTSAEPISVPLSTATITVVRVGTSSMLADSTVTRMNGSTVTNNICKVRPQQQNSQPSVLQSKTTVATPLTTAVVTGDQATITANCTSERVTCDGEGSDGDYRNSFLRGVQPHSALDVVPVQSVNFSPPSTHVSWADNLAPQVPSNFYTTGVGMENAPTVSVWPASNPLLDTNATGVIPCTSVGRTYHSTAEAVVSVGPCSNPSVFSESSYKPSHPAALLPRRQPYVIQHYASAAVPDFNGPYDVPPTETTKFVSADAAHSQPAFSNVAGSVYVSPDQQSNSQSHFPNWGLPTNQHSQVPQPLTQQRYRSRISHQPDAFGNFTYQTELQNDFTYLPTVTGCVPPMPSGGLYSVVHDHSQANYPHGSSRHNVESVGTSTPWSIFGSPPCSSNLPTPGQDFVVSSAHAPVGTGGGLLPHPAVHGGYGSMSCSIASGPSSSSSFVTHQNYVGVIGGGRINADISDVSLRQRGLSPSIYPTHNMSQSTQNQQPFQVHSAFYPSLSPSHQRIQLHHCRANMHNLMNPQTGLYAAAFGAPSQSGQPAPSPLPSRVAYPSMASETTIVPPISFHSQLQPHSFPNVALQPGVHGPRAHQSSAPHLTRNLGSLTNHATSPLLIPGGVGPTGLPGYAQPSPSLSGYPFKHILPTL